MTRVRLIIHYFKRGKLAYGRLHATGGGGDEAELGAAARLELVDRVQVAHAPP